MEVLFTRKFLAKLEGKRPAGREAVLETVIRLSTNPRHPSLRTHKIKSASQVFEAYVTKSDRVTFHYGRDLLVFRNCCEHDIIESP